MVSRSRDIGRLDFGYWVTGYGLWVSSIGTRVSEFRVLGFGFRILLRESVSDISFRISHFCLLVAVRFWVLAQDSQVQSSGFGFKVSGIGIRPPRFQNDKLSGRGHPL